MGQKDLAAKQFEYSAEVFADTINALIFEGEQVDLAKVRNCKIATQYTLENQSGPDYRILLRKAGYEGAIYRQQYDGRDIYPAITLVLYWGDKAWNASHDFYRLFRRILH